MRAGVASSPLDNRPSSEAKRCLRRRELKKDPEVLGLAARPPARNARAARNDTVSSHEPAIGLGVLPREISNEASVHLDGDRIRVVGVGGLADEGSDAVEPNVLPASRAADLRERLLVVRFTDRCDEF